MKNKLDKRKKILFILPTLFGGGAEKIVVNILRKLDSTEYSLNLLLFSKKGNYLELIPDSVKIYSLNIKRTRHVFFRLIKEIKKINPDIIFSSLIRVNIILLLASFFLPKKYKIIIREPNMPSAIINFKMAPAYYTLLQKLLYKKAYRIIAQTDEMKEELIKYYKLKSKQIRVVYNPIDTKIIDKSLDNEVSPYSSEHNNIVASGRLLKQKGYDILIKAFKIVLESNIKFRLYILGEDVINEKSNLIKLAQDLNIIDYITFLGFKQNPYPYIKFADLFVLSSRWEGMPNVVVESIYIGTPVVATKCIRYLNEIIQEPKNGSLVPILDYQALAKKILEYNSYTINKDVLLKHNFNKIEEIFKL